MTPHDALLTARELIANPKNWTQGSYCKTRSDGTRAYCAHGALLRVDESVRDDGYRGLHDLDALLMEAVSRKRCRAYHSDGRTADTFMAFNDAPSTTHAEVLAAFDRAIEATR